MPPKRTARDERPTRAKPAVRGGPPAWVAVAVLLVAIGAVYGRSLHAPFIFDDVEGITNNESIVSLWPLVGVDGHPGPLNPRFNLPSSGRPLVNLSLAANYHWGGLEPFGYHAFNLGIHCLAALLLFAVVRRTLRLPYFDGRFDVSAGWLALAAALLWAIHPLQTEAVIYITQRSELLMALFYLATLYCSLCYWSSHGLPTQRATWLTLAVLASLAGMASKEVMVTAPVMILLFDRTFISRSLGIALRRSWALYVGLACTWLLLLVLNIGSPRGSSAGFGMGIPLISWWATQSQVLLMYLKLIIWPRPLLIHYNLPYLESISQAWVCLILVFALVALTLVLLWRNHPVGYLLTCLLAILSPTSIIPILTEPAAERRMYLPLASIAVLFVVSGYAVFQRRFRSSLITKKTSPKLQAARLFSIAAVILIALTLALGSASRLRAYQEPTRLWREVVQVQPDNALAHGNLGSLLANTGQLPEAINELQAAVSLEPHYPMALCNLGQALTDTGKFNEAVEKLQLALEIEPDNSLAHNNLGVALVRMGRFSEAIDHLQHAIRVQPSFAMAHNNLGGAFAALGKIPEAIEQFRLAIQFAPQLGLAHENLGSFLAGGGDLPGAILHLEEAIRLRPDSADAHNSLANVLRQAGRPQDAAQHFRVALRLQPDLWQTYVDLTQLLVAQGQSGDAIAVAQSGIQLARSRGQDGVADQLNEWLGHYNSELRRANDAVPPANSPVPTHERKQAQ